MQMGMADYRSRDIGTSKASSSDRRSRDNRAAKKRELILFLANTQFCFPVL